MKYFWSYENVNRTHGKSKEARMEPQRLSNVSEHPSRRYASWGLFHCVWRMKWRHQTIKNEYKIIFKWKSLLPFQKNYLWINSNLSAKTVWKNWSVDATHRSSISVNCSFVKRMSNSTRMLPSVWFIWASLPENGRNIFDNFISSCLKNRTWKHFQFKSERDANFKFSFVKITRKLSIYSISRIQWSLRRQFWIQVLRARLPVEKKMKKRLKFFQEEFSARLKYCIIIAKKKSSEISLV